MLLSVLLLLGGGVLASGSSESSDRFGAILLIAAFVSILAAFAAMIGHRIREPGTTPESRAILMLVVLLVLGAIVFFVGRAYVEGQERTQEIQQSIDALQ